MSKVTDRDILVAQFNTAHAEFLHFLQANVLTLYGEMDTASAKALSLAAMLAEDAALAVSALTEHVPAPVFHRSMTTGNTVGPSGFLTPSEKVYESPAPETESVKADALFDLATYRETGQKRSPQDFEECREIIEQARVVFVERHKTSPTQRLLAEMCNVPETFVGNTITATTYDDTTGTATWLPSNQRFPRKRPTRKPRTKRSRDDLVQDRRRIEKAMLYLQRGLGREPDTKELGEHMGETSQWVLQTLRATHMDEDTGEVLHISELPKDPPSQPDQTRH